MIPVNPYDLAVGQYLRSLRLQYMLKQDDVAHRLGVQKAAIARWENGSRGMSVATLLAIADLFGIPGYQLLPTIHQPQPELTNMHATPPPHDDPVAKIAMLLQSRPDLVPSVLDVILAHIHLPAPTGSNAALGDLATVTRKEPV